VLHQCGACRRAARHCHGYRTELETRFVDTKLAKQATLRQHVSAAFDPNALVPGNIDDYALAVFAKDLAVQTGSVDIWSQAPALLAGVKALGCATRSLATRDAGWSGHAYHFYGVAVYEVNKALRTSSASDDATLMAVLVVLDLEAMIGARESAADRWANHVRGASTLISLRGENQLRSVDGRLLFAQALSSLFALCFRSFVRVPEHVRQVINKADRDIMRRQHDPVWAVTKAWADALDLNCHLRSAEHLDLEAITNRAQQIDQAFINALAAASSQWTCTKHIMSPQMRLRWKPLKYLVRYQSSVAAQIWSTMRQGRLLMQAILLHCARHTRTQPTTGCRHKQQDQIEGCLANMSELRTDILASAPQSLGFISPSSSLKDFRTDACNVASNVSATSQQTVDDAQSRASLNFLIDQVKVQSPSTRGISAYVPLRSGILPVLRTTRAYNLLWALSLVVKTTESSTAEHQLALQFLDLLDLNTGLNLTPFKVEKPRAQAEMGV
jgi:hypothetical protein